MPLIHRVPAVNHLLEALPSSDRRRLLAQCETVEQVFAEVLYTPRERLSHVYFPITSFISMIMPIDATASLEVGLIGNEGMFGIPLVLGVDVFAGARGRAGGWICATNPRRSVRP